MSDLLTNWDFSLIRAHDLLVGEMWGGGGLVNLPVDVNTGIAHMLYTLYYEVYRV